jgi:hypothetical protein
MDWGYVAFQSLYYKQGISLGRSRLERVYGALLKIQYEEHPATSCRGT